MKKRLTGLLAGGLVFLLAGCGNQNTSTDLKDVDVEKYVTLGAYKGLVLDVTVEETTAEEIASLVSYIYNNSVTAENGAVYEGIAEDGDTVNIDYVGKLDGEAFDGGTASGQNLTLGSDSYIDGFEDGLIGTRPGETVDLNLTFPENYGSADLAGKDVVFTVTVNYLLPTAEEYSDEVVAGFGAAEFTSVAELNQYAADYLEASAAKNYDTELENTILTTVMNGATVAELPTELIAKYEEEMTKSINSMAGQYGIDADTYMAYFYGTDLATYIDSYAADYAKQCVVFQAIANAEGLNISDEELDAELLVYAENAGYATIEEFMGDEPKESFREYLVFQRVLDFLKENAEPTE